MSAAITFLYNLPLRDQSAFDWATSIRLALVFGIILTWLHFREGNKKTEWFSGGKPETEKPA